MYRNFLGRGDKLCIYVCLPTVVLVGVMEWVVVLFLQVIAEALAANCTLKVLNLESNRITRKGIKVSGTII